MGQIDKNLKNELFKVAVDYIYKEHLVGSQGELAEKIGISASALSRIMSNKKFVGDDTLRKMNEAFGHIFNMAYFRGEEPHCLLMEDLRYYKQHPEEKLVFDKQQETASPAPTAIDYTFLIDSRTSITETKGDWVIAQGGSGTSGYRVWASGFKECWGVVSLTSMTYRYEVTFSMGGYSFINIPIILTTADRNTTSIPQTDGMAVNYSALSAWSAALMKRDKGYFKFVGVGPDYNMQWYAFGY